MSISKIKAPTPNIFESKRKVIASKNNVQKKAMTGETNVHSNITTSIVKLRTSIVNMEVDLLVLNILVIVSNIRTE